MDTVKESNDEIRTKHFIRFSSDKTQGVYYHQTKLSGDPRFSQAPSKNQKKPRDFQSTNYR